MLFPALYGSFGAGIGAPSCVMLLSINNASVFIAMRKCIKIKCPDTRICVVPSGSCSTALGKMPRCAAAIKAVCRERYVAPPEDRFSKMAVRKGDLNEAALHEAVQRGDVAQVRALLNGNVRVDCLDEHGMTPLQHAAYRGNLDMCELLLECGADVNSHFHDSGYTALMFAGLAGKTDVVRLLLEHGASTTAVNTLGRTASQMAAFVSNHDVVSVINNFLPREQVDRFTRRQGSATEAKLPAALASPLYRLLLRTNVNPVAVALYLQEQRPLLDHADRVAEVLDALCEEQAKMAEPNQALALKFHHLAFVVRTVDKWRKERGEGDDLRPLLKSWLRGRDGDDFPVLSEKLTRQSIREFPFRESALLQQLVRTLSRVEVGEEPGALGLLAEAVAGRRESGTACAACGEAGAEKRCSACKSAPYCGPSCQKLHWFTHRKHCARPAEETERREEARRAAPKDA